MRPTAIMRDRRVLSAPNYHSQFQCALLNEKAIVVRGREDRGGSIRENQMEIGPDPVSSKTITIGEVNVSGRMQIYGHQSEQRMRQLEQIRAGLSSPAICYH